MKQSAVRKLCMVVPLCLLAAITAACTSTGSTNNSSSSAVGSAGATSGSAASSVPKGPVKLQFWMSVGLKSSQQYLEQKIKSYEAQHPNVSITLTIYPYTDLPTKEKVALTSGTGPDIFQVGSSWFPQLEQANSLASLSPEALGYSSLQAMKDAYQPGTLDAFINNGQLVALPYDVHSFELFINTADFRAAGLDPKTDYPKTWDQALAVAKKLVKVQGGKIVRNGMEYVTLNGTWAQFAYEPVLFQYGGSALGTNNKCALNSTAGVKAMNVLGSFAKDKTFDPSLSTATAAEATSDITNDLTAMVIGHPSTELFIKTGNPTMYKDGGYEVVPLPQVDPAHPVTVASYNTWGVNRAAPAQNQAAAANFLQFLDQDPSEFWSNLNGVISPLKAAADSPTYKAVPYMDVFLHDIAVGKPLTQSVYSADIVNGEYTALQAVLLQNANAQDALNTACSTIDRAIANGG